MRLSQTPPSLLSLLLVALSGTHRVNAGPFPKDALSDLGFGFLMDRQTCAGIPCGSDGQYCCTGGDACYTNAGNTALCTDMPYQVYTTVFTETDTHLTTMTITSWAVTPGGSTPAEEPTGLPTCTTALGESPCGDICCASNQQCYVSNSCTAYTSTYIPPATSAAGSAPYRPTSGTVSTSTTTVSATTTEPFTPPATASGSTIPITSHSTGGGLSPGAIAGIVIGVIIGILLLILFCFCCIIKAGFDGLLALFGLGKKKRRSTERVEVIEERYSRHGSGAGRASNTWFGASSRPAKVTETRKKNSSGFGGLGYVGAGLLGLAALLGLKRRHDRKEKAARSEISESYYSYTDTSASSASSDRRTRDTRGTRHTRR